MTLFTLDGFMFLLRWIHIFFGIVWIGHLYYFNFVQGAFFGEIDAGVKSVAIQKLVPRALWWFRWGAMWTMATGVTLIGLLAHQMGPAFMMSSRGIFISMGAIMGLIMWANVWFRIWPCQQVVIKSATQAATGGQAIPEAAALAAKSGLASRTNTFFSIPMLFCMAAASHLGVAVNPAGNVTALWVLFFVLTGAIAFNGIKGKLGPLTTIKGVVHCGFAYAIVLYVAAELLLK